MWKLAAYPEARPIVLRFALCQGGGGTRNSRDRAGRELAHCCETPFVRRRQSSSSALPRLVPRPDGRERGSSGPSSQRFDLLMINSSPGGVVVTMLTRSPLPTGNASALFVAGVEYTMSCLLRSAALLTDGIGFPGVVWAVAPICGDAEASRRSRRVRWSTS